MSVKEVQISGNTYLRARRRIGKETRQKYFNIEGLSGKELALAKHQAMKLDAHWAIEQNQGQEHESFLGLFIHNGKFRYLRVASPSQKTGWAVEFSLARQGQKTIYFSRSVDRFGFANAFQQVFAFMVKQMGLRPRSLGTLVLKGLYYQELESRFQQKSLQIQQAHRVEFITPH